MGDDACLQIHHHFQTPSHYWIQIQRISFWCTVEKISFLSCMQTCTNTVTYINTYKRTNTGWGVVPGKSLCIINCRAGYEVGRRTTRITAARSRGPKKPAVLDTLSQSICSLSSCICISAQLINLLGCLVFWQILCNTDVFMDMCASFINIDPFGQAKEKPPSMQ